LADQLLDGARARPTRTALLAPSWAAMREVVGDDTNTIGYLPRAEVDSAVKVLSVDVDLHTLISAMCATEPSGPARDFVAWLQSPAGQAVVAQRYLAIDY